jgi:hypothetical protein
METIFYSWQSDLPSAANRSFIEKALENASREIRKDGSVNVEPVIDRDTKGVAGSPDIADTIFTKIDRADIFVCDVSIINSVESQSPCQIRPAPNPNVLIELGYAVKASGWNRIVMVMNTALGKQEMLPFDLRSKRVTSYHLSESVDDKAAERKKLEKLLESRLREIFEATDYFLPRLSFEDCQLFKRICEEAILREHPMLGGDEVLQLSCGLEQEAFSDSLRVFHDRGYINVAWTPGSGFALLTVLPDGFELYAMANLKGYDKRLKAVGRLIASGQYYGSKELARMSGETQALVELLCGVFEQQKLVRLRSGNGQVSVTWSSPELKRL